MSAVSLTRLRAVFMNMAGRVLYEYGVKAPSLDCDSHLIHRMDCSAFTRYALARASDGELVIPDGSVKQREWCEAHGLHRLARYADVGIAAKDPSRLFVAFMPPKGKTPGHVWLVCAGVTMESHGGAGVSSRAWNAKALTGRVGACYELDAGA